MDGRLLRVSGYTAAVTASITRTRCGRDADVTTGGLVSGYRAEGAEGAEAGWLAAASWAGILRFGFANSAGVFSNASRVPAALKKYGLFSWSRRGERRPGRNRSPLTGSVTMPQ